MRVDFVEGDNWQGLYLDCKLVIQDHSISAWEAITNMEDAVVERGSYYFCSPEWLESMERLPNRLEDVVLDNGKTIRETWDEEWE